MTVFIPSPTHQHLLALSIVLYMGMLVLRFDTACVTFLAQAALAVQLTIRQPCLIKIAAHLKQVNHCNEFSSSF